MSRIVPTTTSFPIGRHPSSTLCGFAADPILPRKHACPERQAWHPAPNTQLWQQKFNNNGGESSFDDAFVETHDRLDRDRESRVVGLIQCFVAGGVTNGQKQLGILRCGFEVLFLICVELD